MFSLKNIRKTAYHKNQVDNKIQEWNKYVMDTLPQFELEKLQKKEFKMLKIKIKEQAKIGKWHYNTTILYDVNIERLKNLGFMVLPLEIRRICKISWR